MYNNIKKKLIEGAMKKYSLFEIHEVILEKILNNLVKKYVPDSSVDIYYGYYFKFNEEIELYILNEIRNGNVLYQIYYSELKQYVIKRYFTVRPDKLEYFNNNVSYRNDEEYKIKFNKYCEYICDDILEEMLLEDITDTINKTMIKKIPKNLTNNYFNI